MHSCMAEQYNVVLLIWQFTYSPVDEFTFGYRKENYYTHLCKSLCVEAFFVFPWVNAQECNG